MKNEKTQALPKTVYVRREQDSDGNYLLVYEDEEESVDDGGTVTKVGIYELKRVKRMRKVAQEV